MTGNCPECNSQIVWRPKGEVCCSECGLIVEVEIFAKISTNRKSRDYDPKPFEHTYFPIFQRAAYRRLERRERGFKDFDKILNSLRTSEELSVNLKMRLLHPSKKLLLDINNQEIEYLCKVGGDLCHFVVTYTQNILTDEFIERYKSLHKTGWIHSRTMEDAALVLLHCLLIEKLNGHKRKATELSSRFMEGGGFRIDKELVEAFLEVSFIGALIDAIEDKYSNRIELLEKRDLPYFMEKEAQRVKKGLLQKHPEYEFEITQYNPKRIDPALSNVRKGDLWKLFRMPYFKGEKPVDMLKCVENEVRIEARRRFRDFLFSLRAEGLKQCKKTGLNATCCYIETHLHEFNNSQMFFPLYDYCLKRGYKSEILVRPVSHEEWAKAFGITRQTLHNRLRELMIHDRSIIKKMRFVRKVLA